MYIRNVAIERADLVQAGTERVRARGWEQLSLRSVAATVGVTPMALYRHVADANELREAVLDSIMASAPLVSDSGELDRHLYEWAHAMRRHLSQFDGVAGWLLVHWTESAATLAIVEQLLARAVDQGVDGFEAVALTNAVFTFVLMRCEAERSIRSGDQVQRSLHRVNDRADLPHLRALSHHYATAEFDTHFDYGLNALLEGVLGRGRVSP